MSLEPPPGPEHRGNNGVSRDTRTRAPNSCPSSQMGVGQLSMQRIAVSLLLAVAAAADAAPAAPSTCTVINDVDMVPAPYRLSVSLSSAQNLVVSESAPPETAGGARRRRPPADTPRLWVPAQDPHTPGLGHVAASSIDTCCTLCSSPEWWAKGCRFYTLSKGQCWLKANNASVVKSPGKISGHATAQVVPPPPPPLAPWPKKGTTGDWTKVGPWGIGDDVEASGEAGTLADAVSPASNPRVIYTVSHGLQLHSLWRIPTAAVS